MYETLGLHALIGWYIMKVIWKMPHEIYTFHYFLVFFFYPNAACKQRKGSCVFAAIPLWSFDPMPIHNVLTKEVNSLRLRQNGHQFDILEPKGSVALWIWLPMMAYTIMSGVHNANREWHFCTELNENVHVSACLCSDQFNGKGPTFLI